MTIQTTSGNFIVELESPPFFNHGIYRALPRAVGFRAIIGRQIFQKASDIFPLNRPARRLFDRGEWM
ncbi:MAG: hypothetical protein ABSB42_21800 [Tepidisphaeraceae bacterium]